MDCNQELYNYAFEGNLDEVKSSVSKGGNIHMAIMGASTFIENNKTDCLKQKEVAKWALENGACLIFSFTQEKKEEKVVVCKYDKNLSMIKGPGDVLKGTFEHLIIGN